MAAGLGNDAAQMALSGVGTSNGKLEEPDHSSSNWYFSRDDIEKRSPSRLDGIDLKKETYFRKSYCTFLQDLGMCLKVPQVTIATAIVFSHRFFLRQSHSRNDRFMIATICMFLAGKVEETPRPLRDVIITSFEIRYKKDPAVVPRIKQKEIYDEHKELVLMGERLVLTTLGFDLNIHHPYKPLVASIKKLKVAQNALAQVAWNFVNDGLRTSLCLQFKPHHIAAGAIFLAAKFLKVKLPSDGEKVWWQEFEVTPRQLEEVSNQMLELYEQNKTAGPGASNGNRPSEAGTGSGLAVNRAKGLDGAAVSNGHLWTHPSSAAGADKVDKHAQTVKTEDPVSSGRKEDAFQGSENSRSISRTEGEYEPSLENGAPEAAGIDGSNKLPRAVANGQVKHGIQDDFKEPISEAKSSMEERETGDVVDSKPGTELNGQPAKVKADAEDEEPKRVLSTTIQDVNTDRVKALKQKVRRSKGEGLDSKSVNAKVEPTDEEELLERELESGVEAAAEAEKVKQERRGVRIPGQKSEYDGVHTKKETGEDGDFISKRRRFNEDDTFNDKKRTKSSERGDRADWGEVELERSRPGASADRVEEGELPNFNSYPYEQARSPRTSERRPMMSGSHENGSPSSKRYRDVHGRRDGHRDNRGQHGGGNNGGSGGGGRERDYHSRDHHHQHRQDGDRERYYHKDRDYQDRDHKKLRAHEVHGN